MKNGFQLFYFGMGVVKRYIHQTLEYSTPKISSDTDRFIILRNLCQANNTGTIGQISALFEYTHEIFAEIVEEASATAARIQSLGDRVQTLYDNLPTVEEETPQKQQLTNLGISYSNKAPEDACQFLPEHRVPSIIHQHEECMPPPNLALLDPYANESCLKKYTNPMFFLESWVEEQNRMYQEAKKKRAARRKRVRANTTTTTKIAVKSVELRRNKYSAMGQEFSPQSSGNRPAPTQHTKIEQPAAPVQQPAPVVAAEPIPMDPPLEKPVESKSKASKTKKTKEKSEKKPREKKSKKTKSKKEKKSSKVAHPPPSDVAPPPPEEPAPALPPPTETVVAPPPAAPGLYIY